MEWLRRLQEFQSANRTFVVDRQGFDEKRRNDPSFVREIETLYGHYVGTFRRSCGNCWHDALIELLLLRDPAGPGRFRLLAGTCFLDPVCGDAEWMLTPRNLTRRGDELALRHLSHNPACAEWFEQPLPADLARLIGDYRRREAAADSAEC